MGIAQPTQDSGPPDPKELDPADLCVVVVSYNSAEDLPGLLESLGPASPDLSMRVVVVDNNSADRSLAVAEEHGAIAVPSGGNLGYSGGINVGRRWARGCAAVLVANPDLRFHAGAVSELFGVALRTGDVTTPRLLDPGGSVRPSMRREPTALRALGEALFGDHWPSRPASLGLIIRDMREYSKAVTTDWATGAALMIPAAVDVKVGPWDESYFLYSEEVDFAARVRATGHSVRFVPSASAEHAEGGSGRSDNLFALDQVNRIRYFRNRHGRMPAVALTGAITVELALRSRRRAHRKALRSVALTGRRVIQGEEIPPGLAALAPGRG